MWHLLPLQMMATFATTPVLMTFKQEHHWWTICSTELFFGVVVIAFFFHSFIIGPQPVVLRAYSWIHDQGQKSELSELWIFFVWFSDLYFGISFWEWRQRPPSASISYWCSFFFIYIEILWFSIVVSQAHNFSLTPNTNAPLLLPGLLSLPM